ncbi:putative immunoglobulin like protein [Trypoxylus dichotomus]
MNVEYAPKSTDARLIIKSVEIQDEASYKCEVTYLEVRENCDVMQIIKLSTLVKPDAVRILTANGEPVANTSSLGPYNEGTNVELTCEAHGGRPIPKVTWYNNSDIIKYPPYIFHPAWRKRTAPLSFFPPFPHHPPNGGDCVDCGTLAVNKTES